MASSPKKNICFYCEATTEVYIRGWPLRDGRFAKLCDSCGSAYVNGTFCQTFHLDSDGWRNCVTCGKIIHCGCIMSCDLYETLDFGGVCCTTCAMAAFAQEPVNQYPSSSDTTSESSWNVKDSFETEHSVDSDEVISGKRALPDSSMNHLLRNETTLKAVSSGSTSQVKTSATQSGDELHKSSLNGNETPSESVAGNQPSQGDSSQNNSADPQNLHKISDEGKQTTQGDTSRKITSHAQNSPNNASDEEGNQTSQGDTSANVGLHPRNFPKISEEELKLIAGDSNSVVVPLFEKLLSVSDAEPKLARLVIPKRCAEAFFPHVHEGQGYPIKIQDTTGKDWKFHLRFWQNTSSKMYVLEGIKKYMTIMNWQAGDIVTFYRKEPEGSLIIGTKKGSSNSATS